MRTVVCGLVLLLAAACGGDDSSANAFPPATNQGGGSHIDAGDASVVSTGDSAGGGSCGTKSCKAGEYCCDGKCGACAPIGMSCPAKPCP